MSLVYYHASHMKTHLMVTCLCMCLSNHKRLDLKHYLLLVCASVPLCRECRVPRIALGSECTVVAERLPAFDWSTSQWRYLSQSSWAVKRATIRCSLRDFRIASWPLYAWWTVLRSGWCFCTQLRNPSACHPIVRWYITSIMQVTWFQQWHTSHSASHTQP